MLTTIKETTNYIESSSDVNASITFEKEVSKNHILDIKQVEVSKNLTAKNVKYLYDINVLDSNN